MVCLQNRKQRWYVWKCAAVVLSTTLFVSLEVCLFNTCQNSFSVVA